MLDCCVHAGIASPMGFDDFLLGFLSCAVLSVTAISLYVKNRKREESRLKQAIAVEILRNLNVAKLRKLLGDVRGLNSCCSFFQTSCSFFCGSC